MGIEEIQFGRVFTHLHVMAEAIVNLLKGKAAVESRLEDALARVSMDPVYIGISSRQFKSPLAPRSGRAVKLAEITDLLQTKASKIDLPPRHVPALKNIIAAYRSFIESHSSRLWRESDGYFTIPVMTESKKERQPGMVFLRASAKSPGASASSLDIGSLTKDPVLLSATEDYFGMVSAVLLQTFYYVQFYPFSKLDGIASCAYRLHFDCQITEGKSMGAAVLALFAVTYIRYLLGETASAVMSPRRGTVITGEIDRSGAVLPVRDFSEKIRCVYDELGPDAKVIFPRGQSLPPDIRFSADSVYPVGNAEELLAAALSSESNPYALDEARAAIFGRLSHVQKSELIPVLIHGVHTSVFDRVAQGGGTRLNPQRKVDGIYALSKASQNLIEIRLALEPNAVADADDTTRRQKELVEVILDGSSAMDPYWLASHGICRMTSVVFEIARRIDADREQLVLGFLSHDKFYEIQVGESAENIEETIQKIRAKNALNRGGAFFRFPYEASLLSYATRLKRIYLISDAVIHDAKDVSDINVSSFVRFYLSAHDWNDPDDFILFPEIVLDTDLMARCFHKEEGRIREVSVCFGNQLPLEWTPYWGNLTKESDAYYLTWKNLNELSHRIHVAMVQERPHELQIRVRIRRGQDVDCSFVEYPTVCRVPSETDVVTDALPSADASLWKTICRPGEACPTCGNTAIHLYHKKSHTFWTMESVFQSIAARNLSDGFLLHQEGSTRWAFFKTGYKANGGSFVLFDGRLHYYPANGDINAVQHNGEFYSLTVDGDTYHLWKCEPDTSAAGGGTV